jgi:hypothetical protein
MPEQVIEERVRHLEAKLELLERQVGVLQAENRELRSGIPQTPAARARMFRVRAQVYFFCTVVFFFMGGMILLFALFQPDGPYWPASVFGVFLVSLGFWGVHETSKANKQQAVAILATQNPTVEPPTQPPG